ALQCAVHMLPGVDDGAAGAQQLYMRLVHVVAAEHRVARDQRKGRRALRQHFTQPHVVLGWCAQADQLPLGPGAAAMHGGINAAGVRRLPGQPEAADAVRGIPIALGVQRLDRDAGPVDRLLVGADRPRIVLLPGFMQVRLRQQLVLVRFVHLPLRYGAYAATRRSRTCTARSRTKDAMSAIALPGWNIRATPASSSAAISSSGTMPPTITPTSPRPASCSAAIR